MGVDAHKATQATGDAVVEFSAALTNACLAIYTAAKAAAKAELEKSTDPGSGSAQESKHEAEAAAAMLSGAETMLWEKTELLAGEPFGEDAIVEYVLEDY